MIFKKIINHIGLLRQEVQNYSLKWIDNKTLGFHIAFSFCLGQGV